MSHQKKIHMNRTIIVILEVMDLIQTNYFFAFLSRNFSLLISLAQYGHSQSEKKLGLGDKYHRSIKVNT